MNSEVRRYLHGLVWDWRNKYESIYPTPEREDSAHFFLSEYTEALDAYLRTNPKYKRNNEKYPSIKQELGDCAFMLITALGKEYNPQWDFWETKLTPYRSTGIQQIGIHVLNSWLLIVETPRSVSAADNSIWKTLYAIDIYTGGIDRFIIEKLDYLFKRYIEP